MRPAQIVWLPVLVHLAFAQALQVQFEGYESPLLVPVDTTWREYKIPLQILTRSDLVYISGVIFELMENDTTGPDSSHFWLDRIHFPSNNWETFEDTTQVDIIIQSPNGTGIQYQYSQNTPDGSQRSLQFSYSRANNLPVELHLVVWDPGNGSPGIPDTIGFWLKAGEMADLSRYIPLDRGNMWILRNLSSSDVAFDGIIEEITDEIALDSTISYSSNRWHYGAGWDHGDVLLFPHSYGRCTLDPSYRDKVFIDDVPWDFDLRSREWAPNEAYFFLDENFENVLGIPTFVKRYGTSLLGSRDFAYGIGLIGYYDGYSTPLNLTGAIIDGEQLGQLDLQNRVGVGISDDRYLFWYGLNTYPPDSSWHRYFVPLSQIMSPYAGQNGFITIWFKPEVFLSGYTGGRICLDNIAIFRGGEPFVTIDSFDDGIIDWQVECALNCNHLDLEMSDNAVPMGGFSLMMNFYNGCQWDQFEGWIYKTVYLDSSVMLSPTDDLVFWMKDDQVSLAVDPVTSDLPSTWQLRQNFPNPFNPSTTLRYELPRAAHVSLVVYDLLGREVATLVEGYMQPGTHQLVWKAGHLPSGIYLARFATPEYANTIKLVLLK